MKEHKEIERHIRAWAGEGMEARQRKQQAAIKELTIPRQPEMMCKFPSGKLPEAQA